MQNPSNPDPSVTRSPESRRRTITTAILGGILGGFLGFTGSTFVASSLPGVYECAMSLDTTPAHLLLAGKAENSTGLTPDDLDPSGYPDSAAMADAASALLKEREIRYGWKNPATGPAKTTITVARGNSAGTVLRVTMRGSDQLRADDLLDAYRDAYETHLTMSHFKGLFGRSEAVLESLGSGCDDGFDSLTKLAAAWKSQTSTALPESASAALGDLGKLRQDSESDIFFFASHLATLDNGATLDLYNRYNHFLDSPSPSPVRTMAFRIALWRATSGRIQRLQDEALASFRSALAHSSGLAPEKAGVVRGLIDRAHSESDSRRKILEDPLQSDLLSVLDAAANLPPMVDPDSSDTRTEYPVLARSSRFAPVVIPRAGFVGGFGLGFLLAWLAGKRFQSKCRPPTPPKPDAEWQ